MKRNKMMHDGLMQIALASLLMNGDKPTTSKPKSNLKRADGRPDKNDYYDSHTGISAAKEKQYYRDLAKWQLKIN